MMNLKRREAVWIFFAVAIVCIVAALFLLRGTSLSASAVNERLYPQANYTLRQFVDGKVEQTRTGQGDTWSIPNNESHKAQAAYFRLRCYDVDGALYYVDGKYGKSVNYHEVGLQLNTVLTRQTMTLKDASGRVLATQTDDEELQIVLEEGEYHVEITIYSSTWTRKSDGKQEYYRLDAEYMFYVDMSAPYLTGTYAEGEEQWHKIGHTVEAKDDISGDIKDFYVVRPNGELVRYYAPQRSYTFQEGDLEGLYTFRAYDDAGWFSGARTVLFDGTAPIGKLSAEDGSEPESGSAVKQGFSFSATDATSGIALLEYKTPSSSDWEPYSDGMMIDSMAEAGEYLFRATDRAGNCTTSSITLQSSHPCAEGHTYRKDIIPPTCTQGGYTHYTCTVCGEETVSDRTDALGHDFREEIHEADCTNAGFTVFICTRCGTREQSGEISALGHDYAEEIVGATCTEGGYSLYTCRRCGESYTDHITAPLGHDYITQTRQPTCTHFGGEVCFCRTCGQEKSSAQTIYPTGHDYSNFIVKAATCTEDGERRYVCDKCGDEYTEVIAAPGHSYATTDSASENGKTTRVYTCTVCGDSYTQELGDQYDEVTSYVEDLFEQYRPYMVWVFLATAAVWSIVMGVFFAIAQKNEDKEKAKRMLVNYFVGLVVIFCILVACPYLIRGIAALVT